MRTMIMAAMMVALLRSTMFAGPADIIKQRAKELNNQNNVRQGVAPPSQPVPPPASAPATQPSQSLMRLQAELAAIPAGSPVTAEQKQKLANGLIAAALAAKPSPA